MSFILNKLIFVTISPDYLCALHHEDQEVFYSPDAAYANKPHIGMLLDNAGYDYAVPLTSAKPKHSRWKNSTGTNFLIYEIVLRKQCGFGDILKEISPGCEYDPSIYVERILSVAELKKMIPVKEGVYKEIDFSMFNMSIDEERKRKNLLEKEYAFCREIRGLIQEKANKIYGRQAKTGIVLPFHCNFERLENVCRDFPA